MDKVEYNSIFKNNTAGTFGGALFVFGEFTTDQGTPAETTQVIVRNTLFLENNAGDGEPAGGGGVLAIPNGDDNENISINIRCSTFDRNSAGDDGGAFYVHQLANSVTISVSQSNFLSNNIFQTNGGGAIYNDSGELFDASGNYWNPVPGTAADINSVIGNVDTSSQQTSPFALDGTIPGCEVPPPPLAPPLEITGQINGKMVFVSDQDGDPEIYLADNSAPGDTPIKLTDNNAIDTNPAFAPDGIRIAYESDVDAQGESTGISSVYVYDTSTDSDTLLVNNASNPVWSSDGSRVVYVRSSGLYLGYPIGNLDEKLLFDHGTGAITDVAWSPDLRWIAYIHNGDIYTHSLYCVNRNVGENCQSRLTTTGSYETLVWSDVGNEIASTIDEDLFIFDIGYDGLQPKRPIGVSISAETLPPDLNTSAVEANSSWSADGNNIIFDSNRDGVATLYEWNISTATIEPKIVNAYNADLSLHSVCPDVTDYGLYTSDNPYIHIRKACLSEYIGVIFVAIFNETSENRYLGLDEIESYLPEVATFDTTLQSIYFADIEQLKYVQFNYDHRYLYARSIINGMYSNHTDDRYLSNEENPFGFFIANYSSSVSIANEDGSQGDTIVPIDRLCPEEARSKTDVRGIIVYSCNSVPTFDSWYEDLRSGQLIGRPDWDRIYRGINPHIFTAIHDAIIDAHDPLLGGFNGVHININGSTAGLETNAFTNESFVTTFLRHRINIYRFNPLHFILNEDVCSDSYPLRVLREDWNFGGDEDAIIVHSLFIDPARNDGEISFTQDGKYNLSGLPGSLRWITFKFQFLGSKYDGNNYYVDGYTTINPINPSSDETIASGFELIRQRITSWCQ